MGAGITAATAFTTVVPEVFAPAEAVADETLSYDAIVIGAGYAGITAARDLRLKGLRVLILEARDRIGGRTWTTTLAGHQIEMGGTWVESTQPHVAAELKRYGIALVADQDPERTFFPTPSGPAQFSPTEGFGLLGNSYERIFEGSKQYFERPFEPLYRADLLKDLDKLSLRDRLNQMKLTAAQELMVNGQTSVYSGGSSASGALTMLAQWWALSGWNNDGWNETTKYRMTTGTVGLLNAMLNETKPTVRLNSPVSQVAQTKTGYHVTTRAGASFDAPALVIAVPVNVWQTIKFSPALPAAQTAATSQGIGVKTGTKLWIHASSPQGRFYAQGAENGSPISMLLPDKPTPQGNLYIAFSTNPTFNPDDKVQVANAVKQLGADMQIFDIKAQRWGSDEFSRGGWAFRKPGQLTGLYPDVQAPKGRLAFASGDIANGWSGYIDGAIESGARAAKDVLLQI
ncbi:putative flavin-containing monoamine oxidase AofH [Streptomyces xanthochromogenes]|uniref:Flavin-containing monoamine oxidase AofH n=1 Tax=Streptomyces xanthochromogenes TaxID=67384 RepID=A0ABQ3AN28_9ACTN|nr:putative flavin-containing monoamine oxidase AofH [Streptomyces xanthochromogenes]